MYVAVKGGERAIDNAHALLADERRGDRTVAEIDDCAQIDEQLSLAVDRVMSEGSLYDRDLAALAIKQARGDLIEAIFLAARLSHDAAALRRFASRSTPPAMAVRRRISATFKDLPGGQVLGPTFDYTHRLTRLRARRNAPSRRRRDRARGSAIRHAARRRHLADDGLIESPTRRRRRAGRRPHARAAVFPAAATCGCRRWRAATKAFLLALGYSTQRGYGRNASVRRRNPLRRGRRSSFRRRARLRRPARRHRRHRMPDGQSVQGQRERAGRDSPAATAWCSARASARRCRWRWSTAPCAREELGEERDRARRRTRNSSCPIATTCRRPASSST